MNIHSFPQSQHGLRTLADGADPQRQKLEAAAEQFEALFLQQILKQMRKAGDVLSADNPMRSRDLDTMRDLYDEALADSMSSRGQTGIRDMLVQQLSGQHDAAGATRVARIDDAPLPQFSGGAFQPVVNAWRHGFDQLAGAWEQGSAAFQRLVSSVVKQESGGRVDAVSPKGALGLMQLMPDTARDMAAQLGIPFSEALLAADGEYNKRLGSAYLNNMLDRYQGSEVLALAAYNAGPGRVDQWLQTLGDPRSKQITDAEWIERIPFSETRNYTRNILQDIGRDVAAEPERRRSSAPQAALPADSPSEQLNNGRSTVVLFDQRTKAVSAHDSMRQSPAFAQPVRIETKESAS
ncbi:lytic transglycosylase domain-containing protein [Pseudomonas profundi]|uniref:lytic transglycosylase domain-containing protein n=1 Tax=Pseudomonas profundi TaxID=1981513 RepID=UPI00123AD376|nr:transglycosylase SLT domain-containing protein [Pseudomonas profundi]